MKTVFVSAGEASGDLHAAALIRALQARHGGLRFFGLGGEQLRAEGVELLYDLRSLAVAGFWEVARKLLHFRRIYHEVLKQIDLQQPELAILIDYPGMNLRLAKELKQRGIKVVYYIIPQVWAWKPERITQIEERVDLLLCILPFEKRLFNPAKIRCEFVGHPLLDLIDPGHDAPGFRDRYGVGKFAKIIALLPGSRATEIARHYHPMLEAIKTINEIEPRALPVVAVREEVDPSLYSEVERRIGVRPLHVAGDTYDLLKSADVAIVASGTATLEAALCVTPFCVVYRTGWITYQIARRLINLKSVGLVNIVAGMTIVPEFLQDELTSANLTTFCRQVLSDQMTAAVMMSRLQTVRECLGKPGAAVRAATLISREFL